MNKSILLAVLCAATMSAFAFTANAAPITFNLTYSGASWGNGASATGYITFEDTLLTNPGWSGCQIPGPCVHALSLTVTGATVGNGTFGLADYYHVGLWTQSPGVDFSTELVGQPSGFELYLDAWSPATVPSSEYCTPRTFIQPEDIGICINAFGSLGSSPMERLSLTSVAPVPVPAAMWLFGSGLIGLLGVARRSRRA